MSCKLVQADTLQFDNIIHYSEAQAYLYIIKKSPQKYPSLPSNMFSLELNKPMMQLQTYISCLENAVNKLVLLQFDI